MQAMTMTKARDLKEGDIVNLSPVRAAVDHHYVGEEQYETVRNVVPDYPGANDCVLYIYRFGGWIVSGDMKLPRVIRD